MAFLLEADYIFPATGASLIHNGAVLVEGEHIRAIGARQDFGQPEAGVQVTRLGGATLLPGLIDLHVHMGGLGLYEDRDPGASSQGCAAVHPGSPLPPPGG
jgi:imidazolonepropionase-like amidohydrolase